MNELTEFKENSTTVYGDIATYNQYFKMAEALSKTELLPVQYRNKPADCLIIIDVARQIGSSPLFVAQNMYVINGKPSWSAQYAASVIKANFKDVKVELTGEGDLRGCRITAKDKNNNICEGTKVTIEMAKQEGWFSKTGSKWKTMPDQMLIYRSYSFFARAYCPDKLLGIHDEFENLDISKIESQPALNPFEDVVEAEVVNEPESLTQKPEEKTLKNEGTNLTALLICENCGAEIDQKVYDYSTKHFGKALCFKCQKEAKNAG